MDRVLPAHPLRIVGDGGLALGLGEGAGRHHLAPAALGHQPPHARHAEEIGLARAKP